MSQSWKEKLRSVSHEKSTLESNLNYPRHSGDFVVVFFTFFGHAYYAYCQTVTRREEEAKRKEKEKEKKRKEKKKKGLP